MSPTIRAAYVTWFRRNLPGFAQVFDKQPATTRAGLSGVGYIDPMTGIDMPDGVMTFAPASSSPVVTDTSSTNWANVISSIGQAASAYVLTKNQADISKQITNIQLQRAAMGQPPLAMSELQARYGISTTPGVNVGVSPDTQKFLMWGGLGLVAVYLLTRRRHA
jgi:hypothetical protein